MAKELKKRRLRRMVFRYIGTPIVVAATVYFGLTSLEPISLATRWKPGTAGIKEERLEEIVRNAGIPRENLEDIVFLKVDKEYLLSEGNCAKYLVSPRVVLIPDANEEEMHYRLDDSLIHELGHCAYSRLTQGQREVWEGYVLRRLDATFKALLEIKKLHEEIDLDKRVRDEGKRRDIMRRVNCLNLYLSIEYNSIRGNPRIDKEVLFDAFDPGEMFAEMYQKYFSGSFGDFMAPMEKFRKSAGVEEIEIRNLWYEGIEILSNMLPKESGNHNLECDIIKATFPDIIKVMPRYWNPLGIAGSYGERKDGKNFMAKVEGRYTTYISKE